MKFNINDYKGKYVMHCKTEEEAKDFCNYLHSVGRRWCGGGSYKNDIGYYIHDDDIVYYFNEGMRGSKTYVNLKEYTILEWSDFMNKEFTKEDLRTGDVVMQRDGLVQIANCELGMFITQNGWNDMDRLNSDLTHKYHDDFDIVSVRRPNEKHECTFGAFDVKHGTLVYERKEVEEMTLAEVCRLLGKEIKIVK